VSFPLILELMAARANAVAGANLPPAGPPIDPTTSLYSGVKIKVTWTSGDETAYSRLYRNNVYVAQVDPGVVSWESGVTSGTFRVSHYKGGQETAKVLAD